MTVAILAGAVCGVLSGMGIGGGTLLMVWMTAVMEVAQPIAQGINLLYFLPTAICALFFHRKNRLIRFSVVLPAAMIGSLAAAAAAYLSGSLDTGLLRKLFGGFLLLVGVSELFFQRERKDR